MIDEGMAWKVAMAVFDKRLSEGTQEEIMLLQLSANDDPIIYRASPAAFRENFTPETLRAELRSKSNPNGSRLFHGIAEGLRFTMYRCKGAATFIILSDMYDTEGGDGKQQMEAALRDFGARNGAVALYGVKASEAEGWENYFKKCGVVRCLVEEKISGDPKLPE